MSKINPAIKFIIIKMFPKSSCFKVKNTRHHKTFSTPFIIIKTNTLLGIEPPLSHKKFITANVE